MDNLLIALKDSKSIIKSLEDVHKFKLKGTGDIRYHLGYNFFRDIEEVLCFVPEKYIEKIISSFKTILGYKSSNKIYSPLK